MTQTSFDQTPLPNVETPRLLVRDMRLEDVTALLRHFGNKEVVQFVLTQPIKSWEQANEWLRWMGGYFNDAEAQRRTFALKDQDAFIGCGGLYGWNREGNFARIGFHILPEFRNEGYATEAATALMEWAWRAMKLNRLEAEIVQGNLIHQRVLEKLGFQREGTLRQRLLRGGKYYDVFLYGLLRCDYEGNCS
jgi:[ribosomal protein S5]-alanine N-acetyltransferase